MIKCGKVPFKDKTAALSEIREIYIKRRFRGTRCAKDGKKIRPYLCPICEKWHLTTRSVLKYA